MFNVEPIIAWSAMVLVIKSNAGGKVISVRDVVCASLTVNTRPIALLNTEPGSCH